MILLNRFLQTFILLSLSACINPIQTKLENATHKKEKKNFAQTPSLALLPPEKSFLKELGKPDLLDPEHLIGLPAYNVKKLLGSPEFKRNDSPAKVWQYRKEICLLDIFFYRNTNNSKKLEVKHIDVRGRDVSKISYEKCFLEVIAKRKDFY